MKKILLALTPLCISFGPLFMSNLGHPSRSGEMNYLILGGSLMVMVGLFSLFKLVIDQQKVIDSLQRKISEKT